MRARLPFFYGGGGVGGGGTKHAGLRRPRHSAHTPLEYLLWSERVLGAHGLFGPARAPSPSRREGGERLRQARHDPGAPGQPLRQVRLLRGQQLH